MGHEPESRLQGMFREYLDKNRSELHDTYEKSFSLYRRADRLLLEIMDNIHPTNDEPEEATTAHRCRVLCLRFYKAMRAAFLLIENDCTVDAFSAVRNMLECCLTLAFLLKDEEQFFEVISDDVALSLDGIYRYLTKTYIFEELGKDGKTNISRHILEFGKTKKKGAKRADAGTFYNETKEERNSQFLYLVYKFISNVYSHISPRSLSIDIEDNDGRLRYGGISRQEMDNFTSNALQAFFVFSQRLDARFLNNKHEAELADILNAQADIVEKKA